MIEKTCLTCINYAPNKVKSRFHVNAWSYCRAKLISFLGYDQPCEDWAGKIKFMDGLNCYNCKHSGGTDEDGILCDLNNRHHHQPESCCRNWEICDNYPIKNVKEDMEKMNKILKTRLEWEREE